MRCSRGLRVSCFHGPFSLQFTDLIGLPQAGLRRRPLPAPLTPLRACPAAALPSLGSHRCITCHGGGAVLAGAAELLLYGFCCITSISAEQLPSHPGKRRVPMSRACLCDFCASCWAFSPSLDQQGGVHCRQTSGMQIGQWNAVRRKGARSYSLGCAALAAKQRLAPCTRAVEP